MITEHYDSGPTSNDLLIGLVEKHSQLDLNYQVIAQVQRTRGTLRMLQPSAWDRICSSPDRVAF